MTIRHILVLPRIGKIAYKGMVQWGRAPKAPAPFFVQPDRREAAWRQARRPEAPSARHGERIRSRVPRRRWYPRALRRQVEGRRSEKPPSSWKRRWGVVPTRPARADRKGVGEGKSGAGRVDVGGSRIKKKK